MKILIQNIDVQLMYNYDHCKKSDNVLSGSTEWRCPSMLSYLKKFDDQDRTPCYLVDDIKGLTRVAELRSHKVDRLV